MKINSPWTSTLFDTLRQVDLAYAHSKTCPAELARICHKEVEILVTEGKDIAMAFSDTAAKLSKRIRFRSYTLPENQPIRENRKQPGS